MDGRKVGSTILQTAGEISKLLVKPDRSCLPADGESLAFIKIYLADKDGVINRQKSREVTIETKGNITLQGFGSADPGCEGSYQNKTWHSYDGAVMAVVRAAGTPGEAEVVVIAEGCPSERVKLYIEENRNDGI